MKSKEEILAATTERTLCIIPDSPLHKAVVEAMQIYADQETAELKKEINRLHDINQQFEAENQRIRNEGVEQIKRLKSELFKERSKQNINFGQ